MATYTYDAWGKIRASTDTDSLHIGAVNPLRYRGYYYDTETGYYYLNSRYYNPTWGINQGTVLRLTFARFHHSIKEPSLDCFWFG